MNAIASHYSIGPRDNYEDACAGLTLTLGNNEKLSALVLCDGVGGNEAGERASAIARDTVLMYLTMSFLNELAAPCRPETTGDGENSTLDGPAISEAMKQACLAANDAILRAAETDARLAAMATTLVLVVIYFKSVYISWAGDSRAYLLRGKQLHRMTKDHSEVQRLVDTGILRTCENDHPLAHRIYSCLGRVDCRVDTASRLLLDGDIVILTSDGLTDVVDDQRIQTIASGAQDSLTFHKLPKRLVTQALDSGTLDNTTVICCRYRRSLGCAKTPRRDRTLISSYGQQLAKVLYTIEKEMP